MLLNFDANYGDNVRHHRQQDSYVPATEVYGHCGITPELEQENAAITLAMPISRQTRPPVGYGAAAPLRLRPLPV